MSIQDHQVSFSFEVNLKEAYSEVRELQTLVYRTLGIITRLGLPEDIEKGIVLIQRMITTINTLRLAIIALQTASGPIGWALALVGVAATAFSYVDTVEMGMDTR